MDTATLAPTVPRTTHHRRDRAHLDWLEECATTTAFRRLARVVGDSDASRIFDAEGLNDLTYPGKGAFADELADHYITLALDAARETA